MQVPYDEGIANHIGPESCAGAREGLGEAFELECRRGPHSTLMPANLITLSHFAVSSAIPFGDTSALIDELHVEGSGSDQPQPFKVGRSP